MTEQEYFKKIINEDEYKKLSPQQQYLYYKAIVEHGYNIGAVEQKPTSIKEDFTEFVEEWHNTWREAQILDEI